MTCIKLKQWIRQYKRTNNYTDKDIEQIFGVSRIFLHGVLTYTKPCPKWLVKKFAEELKKKEELIGLIFGYYPHDFERWIISNPEEAYGVIKQILYHKKLRKKPRG